ncbi:acyl-CoA dehydrogenase family protein [Oceanobacter antarcticus]|uniref:Acyl-CoA dehydrogenase family protein n=1 Tax=Oceanobacter antarcticus TaxID=3133425 RepID=A0ABW8NKK5_9GAMM
MDFAYNQTTQELAQKLNNFMDDHVIPRNAQFLREFHDNGYHISFLDDLKALAKSEGLWNLFLPHLRDGEPGTRLTNMEYAPLAEIMGRLTWASEVFNCSAPDTGNMELLHMFGTDEQKSQWLEPLLSGAIRSCFAMTEPDVASSDATNVTTLIQRDGEDYVINGRKWFITGALNPNCKVAIVMGKTDPNADVHSQQSMILVPMNTPGLTVVRDLSVMNHHSYETHCELLFKNVRVPASHLLGEEGSGFALAQARLGPGRIHHCMRCIGQAQLALDLMAERSLERKTFGQYLHEQGVIREFLAESMYEIEQARLLVLKAAWLIDQGGAKLARNEIAMIKVAVPRMQLKVVDRAMQVFGGMGLSPDTPLPELWTMGRALRIADGPDEVHLRSIARGAIKKAKDSYGQAARFLTPPDRAEERDARLDLPFDYGLASTDEAEMV